MRLAKVVLREIPQNLKMLTFMNLVSAIATTALLGLVAAASQEADKVDARLVLMYAVTITLFCVSHNAILVTASRDAERLIHTFRMRVFDAVRRADLVTVERIGRAALHGVLIQDTQILARVLPILAVGAQQAVMLVFLAYYLAYLSPLACVLAFAFAGLAVSIRYRRTRSFKEMLAESGQAEADVFDGLTDLTQGFKEARMSRRRADALVGAVGAASARARRVNVETKTQWVRNFSLIEAMFYALIGLMVFVVPLVSAEYYKVVVPVTTAALFIVGPISTVSFVTPMVSMAERALTNIEAMEQRLAEAADRWAVTADAPVPAGRAPLDEEPTEGMEVLSAPRSIALAEAGFAYRNDDGTPSFAVGPLTAEFHGGEVTFITGGNGSGKSTMLRLLTGLMPLDHGSLLINGAPVPVASLQDYRDQISAIFSDYHLSRRLYGVAGPDPARVRELLTRLEMQDKVAVADGAFTTVRLSTGQRKRLALVLAQLEDKPVIVLDEWAADQDPHFRAVFYEQLLPELRARGKVVICVTHDERWFDLADRVYQMSEGRLRLVHPLPPGTTPAEPAEAQT
ncbi:cyclic peptide export ABC transporter [Nitrospirillum sp. BR 11163]|uniref:cyclic peptide export ABC transporter n=1 Tax=Nitrospirillum sp. BR 11163 TaxID=3104323 RepID=UPI002AFF3917|nr:cyclic peptide export ABC transporter [Nitrospirillum sp. BR 11163]MEA1673607.1 cyclic peptide export ABC transporter [Nitrospirillum sp. BR 11163]